MTITVTAWQPLAAKIVKAFEGCELEAYPDPGSGGDPWTIGWGATGPGIAKGVKWTQTQADDRLLSDLQRFGDQVAKLTDGFPTTAHQFAAMTSFSYNVGSANLAKSTLLKKHRAGDYTGAQAEFARWNKAAGKVMKGLTRRRAQEAALYGQGT